MSEAVVLNLVLWLPVVGALLIPLLPRERDAPVYTLAFAVMLVQLLLVIWLFVRFESGVSGLQFATQIPWIAAWGVAYHIGLDGLNLLLVLLTALLGPLVVAGAVRTITHSVKLFYAMLLVLQFAMLGTFLAQNLFLFYLFWEAMLIPMFLIIGIWGGERRIYATVKFVLYTAFGSIFMLAAVIYLGLAAHAAQGAPSFAFSDLYALELALPVQTLLLLAFTLAFLIKIPSIPLHTWLPDAHVEAPSPGSVMLAGVLLKMGAYGFLKLGLPMLPEAAKLFTPVLMSLAVASIIYGALLAWVQDDIKKIVAYSSISHMGYVMLGLLSYELLGIQGAIMQMVSHGLISAGLFFMVGMLYERTHHRELAVFGGLAKWMPVYALFFMLLALASVGLPTTSGFTGEFLVLLGAFYGAWPAFVQGESHYALILASLAVLGVILGALYMLRLVRRLLFGPAQSPGGQPADLSRRERMILATLVLAIFTLGIYPKPFLHKTEQAALDYQRLLLEPTPAQEGL